MKKWLLASIAIVVVFLLGDFNSAGAAGGRYTDEVYQNLQKTRDALLSQRDELQRAHDEVLAQINALNAKINRIEQYQKQVDDSIRDVNDALNKF